MAGGNQVPYIGPKAEFGAHHQPPAAPPPRHLTGSIFEGMSSGGSNQPANMPHPSSFHMPQQRFDNPSQVFYLQQIYLSFVGGQ